MHALGVLCVLIPHRPHSPPVGLCDGEHKIARVVNGDRKPFLDDVEGEILPHDGEACQELVKLPWLLLFERERERDQSKLRKNINILWIG